MTRPAQPFNAPKAAKQLFLCSTSTAARLADDQTIGCDVPDQTRLGDGRAHVDDAADDVRKRYRAPDLAVRIDAFERCVADARDAMTEPPRDAIHRRQHDGVRAHVECPH